MRWDWESSERYEEGREVSRHRHWQPSGVRASLTARRQEERPEVALAVMGLLLGLLFLGHLMMVTYGKAENCGLDATTGTGKRLGYGGWG